MSTKTKHNSQISDLHKSLKLLSQQLTFKEYKLVANTMFQLFSGNKFGYKDFDPMFNFDVYFIYDINKQKKLKKQASILQFKVIRGGKTA